MGTTREDVQAIIKPEWVDELDLDTAVEQVVEMVERAADKVRPVMTSLACIPHTIRRIIEEGGDPHRALHEIDTLCGRVIRDEQQEITSIGVYVVRCISSHPCSATGPWGFVFSAEGEMYAFRRMTLYHTDPKAYVPGEWYRMHLTGTGG